MNKVVLAFDSFKGSVSAEEITENLTRNIRQMWPACEVCAFLIADGGEGTLKAVEQCLPVNRFTCQVHGPLGNLHRASYIATEEGVVIIEMAEASGLPLVPLSLRNPLETSSVGTGELIADALNRGFRKFVLGLGGSATNDAGMGVLSALGVRFLDKKGLELQPVGRNLHRVARLDTSSLREDLQDSSFVLACDVTNPLYGPQGAAYVYAPQKGASAEQVAFLDQGLRSYAHVLSLETGVDMAFLPGAGAAGGVAGGLMPFLNGELKSGIEIILDLLHFDDALLGADIVLTGEGEIDGQTAMGKALDGVLKRAKNARVPVVGLGGSVKEVEQLNRLGFTSLISIQPGPVSLEEAMQPVSALHNLSRTVVQLLRLLDAVKNE